MNLIRLATNCVVTLGLLSLVSCGPEVAQPRSLNYELVTTYPHDITAFTQGLLLHEGVYYESTGGYDQSTLRRVDPESGRVLQLRHLPVNAFGEGLALLDDRLFQLEWTSGTGFIYDRESFERLGEFRYDGEGWGLAWDGNYFVLSDGTATLRFMDPDSFTVARTITVRDHRGRVDELNELEFIEGKVYANRWHHDDILVIDPISGNVEATLNLAGLERPRPQDPESVLNGIAYDPETRLLHVTGKCWPRAYVLRVKEQTPKS
jgi:glutamine cyclotransferase